MNKYQLKVREMFVEDDFYFVGTIDEFPDIAVYEDTEQEALDALKTVLRLIKKLFEEKGREMPKPKYCESDEWEKGLI